MEISRCCLIRRQIRGKTGGIRLDCPTGLAPHLHPMTPHLHLVLLNWRRLRRLCPASFHIPQTPIKQVQISTRRSRHRQCLYCMNTFIIMTKIWRGLEGLILNLNTFLTLSTPSDVTSSGSSLPSDVFSCFGLCDLAEGSSTSPTFNGLYSMESRHQHNFMVKVMSA